MFFDNINLFNCAVKNSKKYKCPYCAKIFNESEMLYKHVEVSHEDMITKDKSVKQTIYDETHSGDHLCQICKINKCIWNEKSGRYSTLCDNPQCREEARRRFKENYKKKNGKEHSINDPEIQKEMMKKRKTSGIYKFQDGGTLSYISSYEKDFLEFYDLTLGYTSDTIIECPYVFNYVYEGKNHFYIPDYYIPLYDLIIEVKADDDITHPKILAVDKEMEKLKDEAVKKDGTHNFIKIVDKKYDQFVDLLNLLKNNYLSQKPIKEKIIIIPKRKEDIRGFTMPKLNFLASDKTMTESYIMKKLLDSVNGVLNLSLVIDKDNINFDDPLFKSTNKLICKTYECDFKNESKVKTIFNEFSHYYTKQYEHFINQDYMSIRMDISNLDNWFMMKVKFIDLKFQQKLINLLDYVCVNNDILIYSFISTSTGFILLAEVSNDQKRILEKYCNNIMKQSEYSKSSISYDKESVQLPGSFDASTEVKIIQ